MFSKIFKYNSLAESLLTALIMALVGGLLDIYTYLCRGKVFANTQTGNLVLLGHNIAEGNLKKVVYYAFPIVFFMLGVAVAELLEHQWKGRNYIRWEQAAIIIEIVILLLVMVIPLGTYNLFANILVSYSCGLQVQTFRKVNKLSYSSTMFTGNVKNAAERLSNFAITKEVEALESAIVYFSIIFMFICGGVVGDLLIRYFEGKAVGFAPLMLILVFIMLHREKVKSSISTMGR
ncbi:YoaK family protein [Clostridium culturomicium]|uniref:YoaK family protein n=1 Tax=Clostridium culturomicium TaxID=1499683 RepID=UPI000591025B|nr:YoaK family protein [Clostridium culturomicium]